MSNVQSIINVVRGKSLVDKASPEDVKTLIQYIDQLETLLDEADLDDYYGTEGWITRVALKETK